MVPAVAFAHDSAVPHTHLVDNGHSDLFVLCAATAALMAGWLLLRGLRRGAKPQSRLDRSDLS
jgi:hypothetical protein